jgi:hypothetical protein
MPGPGIYAASTRLTASGEDVPVIEITDEMLARLIDGPSTAWRRPRLNLAPLIPVGHGIGAIATFLLAVLTAVGARLRGDDRSLAGQIDVGDDLGSGRLYSERRGDQFLAHGSCLPTMD